MLSQDVQNVVAIYLTIWQLPNFFINEKTKFRYDARNEKLRCREIEFIMKILPNIVCTGMWLDVGNGKGFGRIPTKELIYCYLSYDVRNCDREKFINEFLCRIKHVSSLTIEYVSKLELNELLEFINLDSLELIEYDNSLELNVLMRLNLRIFKLTIITGGIILNDDIRVFNMCKLRHIELHGTFDDFRNIELRCENLRKIVWWSLLEYDNFVLMTNSSNLSTVKIRGSASNCTNLLPLSVRTIKFIDCDDLVDVSWLCKYPKLKRVSFVRCKFFSDVSASANANAMGVEHVKILKIE